MSWLQRDVSREAFAEAPAHRCGAVRGGAGDDPVDLTLLAEHRRGHGPATLHDVGKTVKQDEPEKKRPACHLK
jgi:hypothetical protein